MTLTTRFLRIDPLSPLTLGNASSVGNFQATLDHIPGSMVRGSVAGQLIEACLHQNNIDDVKDCPDRASCPFWQLFGEPEPLFGAAYSGNLSALVFPPPLTLRTCKRHEGISSEPDIEKRKSRYKKKHDDPHGVFDVLLPELAYDLVTDPTHPLGGANSTMWRPETRYHVDHCPVCEDSLDVVSESTYYHYLSGTADPYSEAKALNRNRMTHVGINRARSVAQDNVLFIQERIRPEAGQLDYAFFARVTLPEAKVALFEEAIDADHYIGRGRSRGNGHIKLSFVNMAYPSVEERVTQFNEAWQKTRGTYNVQDDKTMFSLTLRSPAILARAGIPYRVPTPTMLGLPNRVTLERAWARTMVVGGWDSAAKLPRRTQMATKTGSVFVYSTDMPIADILPYLETIEQARIGLDRERGFGEVTICAAIHTDLMAR